MRRRDDRTEVAEGVLFARNRLRTRLMWGTVLSVLVPLAPLLVALSALPALRGLAWGAGLAVLLMALAWKAQHLPREAETARWLDERLGSRGLLVAAEHCVGNNLETPQAQAVLAEAADLLLSPMSQRLGLPWKPLVLRGILAGVLAGTVFVALTWIPGTLRPGPLAGGPTSTNAVTAAAEAAQKALESRLDPQTAELLRNHPQWAALAEQALAQGDVEGLKNMLDQAQAGGNDPSQAEPAPTQEPKRQQQKPAPSDPEQKSNQPPTTQPVSGSNNEGKAPPQPGSDGNQSQQNNPGKDANPNASQSRDSKNSSGQPSTTEAPSPGGKGTGTGHSDAKQGQFDAKAAAKGELKSADPFSANLFEIKLPGKDAKMSLQQALAATSRSAEAALQSSSAPLEYESAVRDYFLTLSHKEQP